MNNPDAPVILPIFGQGEEAAANHLIANGKATRISPFQVPDNARHNSLGQTARFAVSMPHKHVAEFVQRSRDAGAFEDLPRPRREPGGTPSSR
jgi:hypothetical protein